MKTLNYDVVVIGGGAAGLGAAATICRAGLTAVVIDREDSPGGILPQCIHNGFGIHHFHEELTGPEYAERTLEETIASGADFYMNTTAVDILSCGNEMKTVVAYSKEKGVLKFSARAVILAMGCRERNRGNLGIPGSRPSGIFTAGLAQRLLNIDGCLPGSEAVIIGSGDIGLIMARRLNWVGIKVKCVVEILSYSSGLTRNIVQCLNDFDIPLYLSHSVTRICGKDRVEAVEIAPLLNGIPDREKTFTIKCDTILLSVGLVPENELSKKSGIEINQDTGGPYVDANMMTSVKGIFACGNVLHVHDLVDFVSEESAFCAGKVVEYLTNFKTLTQGRTLPGANIKYVVPNYYVPGIGGHFYMRALSVKDKAELTINSGEKILLKKTLRYVRPSEMLKINIPGEIIPSDDSAPDISFNLNTQNS